MRQSENEVKIEGYLQEVDLREGNKDGKEYIAGFSVYSR